MTHNPRQNRRFWLIQLLGCVCAVLAATSLVRAQAKRDVAVNKTQPNILVLMADDVGYGDLGCYGGDATPTPHIDALAQQGMRFTDFHSNSPVCSPTRTSFLTGLYPQRCGIDEAIGFTKDVGVSLDYLTLAEALHQRGYTCGVFGKWHLGYIPTFGPNQQGFDVSYCSNNTPDYHTHISRTGEYDWWKDGQVYREDGYLTTLVTHHTIEFLEANRDRPFFAFVSQIAVHFPYQGPNDPPLRTEGKIWHDQKLGPLPPQEHRRAYRDMLIAMDNSIGQIMAALDRLGLRSNTLVVFLSDNGAYTSVGSNAPYRGQKTETYEGGHRVPMIAIWPERIAAGAVSDAFTMSMDLAPTILSIAAPEAARDMTFDGIDLGDVLLHGATLPERTVCWQFHDWSAARQGRWKLVTHGDARELYNLKRDPGEQTNLIDKRPKIAARLQTAYDQWINDVSTNPRPTNDGH